MHYSRNRNHSWSMGALLSATYRSSPLHSQTGNTILQFLYSAPLPLGRTALVSSVFSHSLSQFLFFISLSPSLFPFFSLLWKTQFWACLSGVTPQMKWHTVDEEEKEAFCCMAWNWIPMTSSARRNTSHSSAAEKGWGSITLDGFTQWLLYPLVINWNHCFIMTPD